jgi:predicted deacetylase
MYKISKRIHKIANEYGLIVEPSRKGLHKLDVYNMEGQYIASIGDRRYKDYWMYREEDKNLAKYRQHLYYLRHKKGIEAGYRREVLSAIILWDIRV